MPTEYVQSQISPGRKKKKKTKVFLLFHSTEPRAKAVLSENQSHLDTQVLRIKKHQSHGSGSRHPNYYNSVSWRFWRKGQSQMRFTASTKKKKKKKITL